MFEENKIAIERLHISNKDRRKVNIRLFFLIAFGMLKILKFEFSIKSNKGKFEFSKKIKTTKYFV